MPGTVSSIQLTFFNDGSSPTDPILLFIPQPWGMLHTVRARLEPGGLLTAGRVIVLDYDDIAVGGLPDEVLLYESGPVVFAASATTASLIDVLDPPLPITAQYQTVSPYISTAPKSGYAAIAVMPTAATGTWTVSMRLTTSTS